MYFECVKYSLCIEFQYEECENEVTLWKSKSPVKGILSMGVALNYNVSLVKSRKREKCPDFPGMEKKIITSLVVVIYLEKGYVIVGNGLFWLKHKEAQRKINVSMFIGWGGESMCVGERGRRRIRKRSRRRREKGVEERRRIYLVKAYIFQTRVVICGKRWLKTIDLPLIFKNFLIIQERSGPCHWQTKTLFCFEPVLITN